jgi:hypothetical protein
LHAPQSTMASLGPLFAISRKSYSYNKNIHHDSSETELLAICFRLVLITRLRVVFSTPL